MTTCSELSSGSGEPLYGSCGRFDHWVFVSLPIARWHATSALQSHGMPPELAEWLGEELKRGVKISLRVYDDPETDGGRTKVKLYPSAQEIVLGSPSEVVGALRRRLAGDEEGWRGIASHEFFICNDPGHDACCAKLGPPVFEAVSRLLAERGTPIKAFRCSHLGGHKFAATGVLFPHGHMYGRMNEKNVAELLAAVADDDIFPACYRGGVWMTQDEQIATYVAASRGWLEGPVKRVRVNEVVSSGPDRRHLHAEVPGAMRFTVALENRKFMSPGSCSRAAERRFVDRWVIIDEAA